MVKYLDKSGVSTLWGAIEARINNASAAKLQYTVTDTTQFNKIGNTSTIYLIAQAQLGITPTDGKNIYNEYIYIPDSENPTQLGHYELIGTTEAEVDVTTGNNQKMQFEKTSYGLKVTVEGVGSFYIPTDVDEAPVAPVLRDAVGTRLELTKTIFSTSMTTIDCYVDNVEEGARAQQRCIMFEGNTTPAFTDQDWAVIENNEKFVLTAVLSRAVTKYAVQLSSKKFDHESTPNQYVVEISRKLPKPLLTVVGSHSDYDNSITLNHRSRISDLPECSNTITASLYPAIIPGGDGGTGEPQATTFPIELHENEDRTITIPNRSKGVTVTVTVQAQNTGTNASNPWVNSDVVYETFTLNAPKIQVGHGGTSILSSVSELENLGNGGITVSAQTVEDCECSVTFNNGEYLYVTCAKDRTAVVKQLNQVVPMEIVSYAGPAIEYDRKIYRSVTAFNNTANNFTVTVE